MKAGDLLAQPGVLLTQPGGLLAQQGDLLAQRHERAVLARLDPRFREQLLQPLHFRLERQRVLRRATNFLHLTGGLIELLPAELELPLERTRTGTGIHLLPPQLLAASLRRIRARTLALVQ